MKNSITSALMATNTELTNIRTKISGLKQAIEEVSNANITLEEAKERVEKWLKQQSENYKGFNFAVDAAISVDSDISRLKLVKEDSGIGLNITPFICQLFGNEIKQVIFKKIESLNIPSGYSPKEREKKLSTLNKELWELEIMEEKIIYDGEETGYFIPRRRDCNAKIVLKYKENEA